MLFNWFGGFQLENSGATDLLSVLALALFASVAMGYVAMIWVLILASSKLSTSTGPWVAMLNKHRSKPLAPLVEAKVTEKRSSVDPFEDERWGKMSLSYTASGDNKDKAFEKVVEKFLQFAKNEEPPVPEYKVKLDEDEIRVEVDGEYYVNPRPNSICKKDKKDSGGNGEILFCVTDEDKPREVVIKVMPQQLVEKETKFYKLLKDEPAVPSILASGVLHGYKVDSKGEYDHQWKYHNMHGIVIQKYGISVQHLYDFCNSNFFRSTTLAIAVEMAKAYESFLEKKVVHIDVKPGNMLYSPHAKSNNIKIIDFECSALHGEEVPHLVGTTYFMSRNSHNFKSHRVFSTDDLETMDSVLALFWRGVLPWYIQTDKVLHIMNKIEMLRNKRDTTKMQTELEEEDAKLRKQKNEMWPTLFSDVPGLDKFTKYIYEVDPSRTPDYTYLKERLNDAVKSHGGISTTTEMDWIRRPKMLFESEDILTVSIAYLPDNGWHKFTVEFEPYYNSTLRTLREMFSTVEISDQLHIQEIQEKSGQILVTTEQTLLAEIANLNYSSFDDSKFYLIKYYQHIYVNWTYNYNDQKEEYLVSMAIKGCLEVWDKNSPLTQAINKVKLSQMSTDEAETYKGPIPTTEKTLTKINITVENILVVNVEAFRAALAKITPKTHKKLLTDIAKQRFTNWGYLWHVEPENKLVMTFIFTKKPKTKFLSIFRSKKKSQTTKC